MFKKVKEVKKIDKKENIKMKVFYSKSLVKEIICMIEVGNDFEKISEATGVKSMTTIHKWLDTYYTVKKVLCQKWYNMLKRNNAAARQKAAEEKAAKELQEALINKEPDEPFEEWAEKFFSSDIDFLIDSRMNDELIENAIAFAKHCGKSYQLSTANEHINIQAIMLGFPAVITNSGNAKKYCDIDGIPFVDVRVCKGFVYEASDSQELEWKPEILLPGCTSGKGRVCCCIEATMMAFAKEKGFTKVDKVLVNNKTPKAKNMEMKPGDTIEYRILDGDKCFAWVFELQTTLRFKEIAYSERPLGVSEMRIAS